MRIVTLSGETGIYARTVTSRCRHRDPQRIGRVPAHQQPTGIAGSVEGGVPGSLAMPGPRSWKPWQLPRVNRRRTLTPPRSWSKYLAQFLNLPFSWNPIGVQGVTPPFSSKQVAGQGLALMVREARGICEASGAAAWESPRSEGCSA